MASLAENLRRAILGRHPVVYLVTWEEERAVRLLEAYAAKLLPGSGGVRSWSCIRGLQDAPQGLDTRDPVAAVQAIVDTPGKGFWVLRDFPAHLDRPDVQRAVREAYAALQGQDRFLFLLAPELQLPVALSKEVFLAEVDLPGDDELLKLVQDVGRVYPESPIEPELAQELAVNLRGLTAAEAGHLLHRIARGRRTERTAAMAELFAEKESVVKKTGFLEFVPPKADLAGIGGLDVLKDWLVRRRKLFSQQAIADGVPIPRGILIMGMSGCGKSLAAKAASSLWNVPLFRLDMNLVFSGLYGSPEAAFHRALRTTEALAPAILWIDEIENSLGMADQAGGGSVNSSVFSSFLTWMQEKPPLIFVAATANRIQDLPAEIIRKGRFDQVFFVDLPGDDERREILEIHLRANGVDPAAFDTNLLALSTRGWNGAELEQAVVAARVDAYHGGHAMTPDDLSRNISLIVPLSKTMEEQMKRIRSWAFGRATPASSQARRPRS